MSDQENNVALQDGDRVVHADGWRGTVSKIIEGGAAVCPDNRPYAMYYAVHTSLSPLQN